MGIDKTLIGVSWAMPPIVTPRSIQVARVMSGLRSVDWKIHIVTVDPVHHTGFFIDSHLSTNFEVESFVDHVDLGEAPWHRVLRERNTWQPNRLRARFAHKYHHYLNRAYSIPYVCAALPKSWIYHPYPYWDLPEWRIDVWRDRAIKRTKELLEQEESATLVTFGQPWVDHEVGLRVARRSGSLKWIAHFSDPWTDSPYFRPQSERDAQRQRQIEASTVERADNLVFVTEETAELVMRKYPKAWSTKVRIIPHALAADSEAFPGNFRKHDNPVTKHLLAVHIGSLYGDRQAHTLLQAISSLRQSHALPPKFRLRFVGHIEEGSGLFEYAQTEGLSEGIVEFVGPCSWADSQQAIRKADVLLAIEAPTATSPFLPSKLMDYLVAGKTIIGITPLHSPMASILRETGHFVAAPNDVPSIAEAILAATRKDSSPSFDQLMALDYYKRLFSRETVTAAWDSVLASNS